MAFLSSSGIVTAVRKMLSVTKESGTRFPNYFQVNTNVLTLIISPMKKRVVWCIVVLYVILLIFTTEINYNYN